MTSLGRVFVIVFGTGLVLTVLQSVFILGPQDPGMIGFIVAALIVLTAFVQAVGMDIGWWLAVALVLAAFHNQFPEPPDRPMPHGTVPPVDGDVVT